MFLSERCALIYGKHSRHLGEDEGDETVIRWHSTSWWLDRIDRDLALEGGLAWTDLAKGKFVGIVRDH